MPRPPTATSAFEAFPAQEFDAWVDRLRHTITDGLERPEVPFLREPVLLSRDARAAIKTAKEATAIAQEATTAVAQAADVARPHLEDGGITLQRGSGSEPVDSIDEQASTLQLQRSYASDTRRDWQDNISDLPRHREEADTLKRRGYAAAEEKTSVDFEERQAEEDEEDIAINVTRPDFQAGDVSDTFNYDDDKEFEDGSDRESRHDERQRPSPVNQSRSDDLFEEGDEAETVFHENQQQEPIEVDSDVEHEEDEEDSDEEREESGLVSDGDEYVNHEEEPQYLAGQQDETGMATGESAVGSEGESEGPDGNDEVGEMESDTGRESVQGTREESAPVHANITEEEEDVREAYGDERDQDGDTVPVTSDPAPPQGYQRRIFMVRGVNEKGEEVYYRTENYSEGGEEEEGEEFSDSRDGEVTSDEEPERNEDGIQYEGDEAGTAQSGYHGITLHRGPHMTQNSLSPGGEDNAIEVEDESDEDEQMQRDSSETQSEENEREYMAQERVGSTYGESEDEGKSGKGSDAGEEYSDGDDDIPDSTQLDQRPHNSRGPHGESRAVEVYGEGSDGDPDRLHSNEDDIGNAEDADAIPEPNAHDHSSFAMDDGVDELADDDMNGANSVYLPQALRHIQPRLEDMWDASHVIDPALQTRVERNTALTDIASVAIGVHASNRLFQASSTTVLQERVHSPSSEQVTSAQLGSPRLATPSREDEAAMEIARNIDNKTVFADNPEEPEENHDEIINVTNDETRKSIIVPSDGFAREAADERRADVPDSDIATASAHLFTPISLNIATEYEADDERSAHRALSTALSKETIGSMATAETLTVVPEQPEGVSQIPGLQSGMDDDLDGNGRNVAEQEYDDDELVGEADVSSNGDDTPPRSPYVSGMLDDVQEADQEMPVPIDIPVQEQSSPCRDNALGEEGAHYEERMFTGDVEICASEDPAISDHASISGAHGLNTEMQQSSLQLAEPAETISFKAPGSFSSSSTLSAEPEAVPSTGPIEVLLGEHGNAEFGEDQIALPGMTRDDNETTVTAPSAVIDVDVEYDQPRQSMLDSAPTRSHSSQGPRKAVATVFDRSAEFIAIRTPSESEQDELEEGEIRNTEDVDLDEDSIPRDNLRQDIEGEASLPQEDELGESASTVDEEEEGDEDTEMNNLPPTENTDGIRRGPAEVMGSRLDGVRVDEIATLEEDDEDSQQDPHYDDDSSESAEDIQYDSDDPPPLPIEVEQDGIEVNPENPEALQAEIRSHDLSDIPHKAEHLMEEDEEYDDDEPEHHIDGRPAGYEGYDVVDETDPNDVVLFEIAEREHGGIEGNRTTDQLTIQEMELRQQPGNAVRAARDSATACTMSDENDKDIQAMPTAPSPEQIQGVPSVDSRSLPASMQSEQPPPIDAALPTEAEPQKGLDTRVPSNESDVLETDQTSLAGNHQHAEANRHTPPVTLTPTEDDNMFDVELSTQPQHSFEHPASVIALLEEAELPQAPWHDRSLSPLASEEVLRHDIALAMEPAPLLHRHDHHHNVVLEESHRIHEAKRQSFASAIASVQEEALPPGDSENRMEDPQGYKPDDDADVELPDVNAIQGSEPLSGDAMDSHRSPQARLIEAAQSPVHAQMENVDEEDDPLRLSGPFNDTETMSSSRMQKTEVYVELPTRARDTSHSPDRHCDIEERPEELPTLPSTPVRLPMLGGDDTRHHHGPAPSTSFSSLRSEGLDISGSPAAHTRSQCHYHKIRFGRGVFSHVVLVPHCSIGTIESREQMGANDLGRVTREEMSKKRDLIFGNTFTSKMTSDVAPLPENLEHQIRQLAGNDLLREGHVWLLPLEDVAPESPQARTDVTLDVPRTQDVYHTRSSPRLQPSSQTPDRKRKRGTSHARSTSATRSDGDPAGSSQRTRSPSFVRVQLRVPRHISQIAENNEEDMHDIFTDTVDQRMKDDQQSLRFQRNHQTNDIENGGSANAGGEVDGDAKHDVNEKASLEEQVQLDDGNIEEDADVEEHPSKKRIVELEDGEGPSAVKVESSPPKKTGWLSWLLGRKS